MMPGRRDFLRGLAGTGMGVHASAEGRPLTCCVVDDASGRRVPARVRLYKADGKEMVPLGHSERLGERAFEGDVRFQSRRFAYVDGCFQVDPAWLPLKYQVVKGYQFRIAEGELRAENIRDGVLTVPLSRWSSLSRSGWYSGYIHIHHIAPRTCRL